MNVYLKHVKNVSVRHKKSQKSFLVDADCNQEPPNLPRLYQMDPNGTQTEPRSLWIHFLEMVGGQDNVRPSHKLSRRFKCLLTLIIWVN